MRHLSAMSVRELPAAVTLLVIAIPEQLATAHLAGMPPVTGYYAFIAAAVAFVLVGRSATLSVGADSTIAPLVAAGLAPLALAGSSRYLELAAILAVVVGVLVTLVGVLRLGWIAEFLSVPVITGFMAGIAIVIVIHQLPDLLGLGSVTGADWHRVITVLQELNTAHLWPLIVGLGVLVITLASERVSARLPGTLIALIVAVIAVAALGLQQHGVSVIGSIGDRSPRLGLAGLSLSAVVKLLPIAALVALVVVTQTAATARAFGHDETTADVNRNLMGAGAANVLAGVTGAFPVDASPPRTAAVVNAGGRSRLPTILTAVVLAILIPIAGVLSHIPFAALSGVLLYVALKLFDVRKLASIARFDRFEFGLAVVTMLTVGLIGVEQGVGVAVVLALLDRTRLTATPRLHRLGQIPGTTSWVRLGAAEHPVEAPGVLVVSFATPLWYANATHFREQITAAVHAAAPPPRLLVLDAIGMSDIDYTGAAALGDVLTDLDGEHVRFAVARLGNTARASLERSGVLARIGARADFASVDEAVRGLSE